MRIWLWLGLLANLGGGWLLFIAGALWGRTQFEASCAAAICGAVVLLFGMCAMQDDGANRKLKGGAE